MEKIKHTPKARANGEGTIFKMKNGKYRVEVTTGWDDVIRPDGTKYKKRRVKTKSGFSMKRDAVDWLKQFDKKAPDNKKITFKQMYDIWSKQHFEKIAVDTVNGYKVAIGRCDKIGDKIFASLKAAELQSVVDECKMSRRTKEDIRILMNLLYKYALENDYCSRNYASFVKLPKKEKSKRDAFTKEERNTLWKDYYAGNKFTGEILFLIYCGLRFGEYKTTERDKMFLDKHYFISGIKTEAGIDREIPIMDCVYDIAKELLERSNGKKYLLTLPEKTWYTLYHATTERLKIRDLNPHCCRHTTATALAEAGTPPAIITAILGHESYEITLEYTHISIEEKLKWANKQYSPSSSVE